MTTGTIYNPTDNSLDAKLDSLREVFKAREQVKASKQTNDQQWANVLGSMSEIEMAEQVIDQSFSLAVTDFNKDELREARSRGAVNEKELGEMMSEIHRQQTVSKRADSDSHSNKDSHGRRR